MGSGLHKDVDDSERHEPKGASTANLNDVISSDGVGGTIWSAANFSPSGAAGGDLSGSYPNPSVSAITDSSSTSLSLGSVPDGTLLGRSGTSIIGVPIPPSLFDPQWELEEDISFFTTTLQYPSELNVLTQLYTPVNTGTYEICLSYLWNHNNAGNDFIGTFQLDGVELDENHIQEPKDSSGTDPSGSDQRHVASRRVISDLTSGVLYTFTFNISSSSSGIASSVWDSRMTILRRS